MSQLLPVDKYAGVIIDSVDIPVIQMRCFTCGKVVAGLPVQILKRTRSGMSLERALTDVGLIRMCCRQTVTHSVDHTNALLMYSQPIDPAGPRQNKRTYHLSKRP